MRKKILIIDNEKDITDSVKNFLESDNKYYVMGENNPKNADVVVRKFKPDLILLDINMPGRNGFDLLRSFKKDKKTMAIPVIMLTGVNDNGAMIRAAELFTEGYMVKPVSAADLRLKIESVLAVESGAQPKTGSDNEEVPIRAFNENVFFGEAHKISSSQENCKAGSGKILVVDDEKSMCELIRAFLVARGFQATACSDPKSAMAIFSEEDPDIVTLDMVMADVDGMELLKNIKEKKRGVKVIMLTGINDPEIIKDAMSLGADDIIMKPFSMDQLYATIIKHSYSINKER